MSTKGQHLWKNRPHPRGMLGKHHSEEAKKKMSKNHWDTSGKNHPFYGKHLSLETRKKISIANKGKHIGKFNPMYGKHLSKKVKAKISKFFKGKKQSFEHKIKRGLYRTGENALNWKGGITKCPEGYISIKIKNHPFCNSEGYIRRSRFIMERHLGHYLHPKEVVHHINGIKDDDRIENLRLFKNNIEHMKFHSCKRERNKIKQFS